MTRKLKILIVEDEISIATGLTDVFLFHGYEVKTVGDGKEGLTHALTGEYDLILLDVMLPHFDGFTVCNKIRERDRDQPIIMLTAKTSDEDIIRGLSIGADDYVAKPFSVQELVLRVESVLRRSRKIQKENRSLTLGALSIDTATLNGVREGRAVQFTRREVEIIEYLLANQDRPVSRGELLEEVWGYRKASTIDTRTVDIHIAKIRKKIEPDQKEPTLLRTVRGEGYQLFLV